MFICKFGGKANKLICGTKKPDLGILGLESENNIVIFEIHTLEFLESLNFPEKQKCLNLRPKRPVLCIFDQKSLICLFLD